MYLALNCEEHKKEECGLGLEKNCCGVETNEFVKVNKIAVTFSDDIRSVLLAFP